VIRMKTKPLRVQHGCAAITGQVRRLFANTRSASVIKGVSTSMLLRVVTSGMALITIPLTVSYLGKVEYGVWMTITGMLVWLNMVDLGISNSAINKLSTSYASRDYPAARRCVANVMLLSLILVSLIGGGAAIAIWMTDWSAFMKLQDAAMGVTVRNALLICLCSAMASFVYHPISKVSACFQFGHIQNYWSLLATLASFAALLVAIYLKGGLLTLSLTVSAGTVAVLIASTVWLFWWKLPQIRPRGPEDISIPELRSLLSTGISFFILQLCVVAILQMELFLISWHLGAEAVAPYSVTARVLALATIVESAIIVYLWPAYSEAIARGDRNWIKKALVTNWVVGVGATLAIISPMLFWGQEIVGRWAGQEVVPLQSLIYWLAGFRIMFSIINPMACLLNAMGKIKEQIWIAGAKAVGVLILSSILVPRMGSQGMAATLTIIFAASLVPFIILLRKSMSGLVQSPQTSAQQ
jgi:O-antigen/teichoic acid export membrane protein